MKEKKRQSLSRQEAPRANHGNPVMSFISGMGLGAGIMYVLDPDRGNRRRAMAQQKIFRLVRRAGDAVDKGVRDLEHRVQGIFAEGRASIHHEDVADSILEQRVRSKLGRVACHPGSIEVRAQGGQVTLSGPVLRGELQEINKAVQSVRGVRQVESRLEEHGSAEDIPGLQGRSHRPGSRPELLQENWAPGTRLVMGSLGLMMVGQGARRPGLLNSVWGIAGLALLAHSARRSRLLHEVEDAIRPAAGARAGGRRQGIEEPISATRRQRGRGHGDIRRLLSAREIPRHEWVQALDQLSRALDGVKVTVEVQDGGHTRVEQRDLPFDGIGADVKDQECTVNLTVGKDAHTQVTHSIAANAVRLRNDGDAKLLEIDAVDGAKTIVRFRVADLRGVQAA